MNEKKLVQQAQNGDFSAFTELINAHKGRIYSLALKMTNNPQDSEDIVQDTFLKAIDKIDQFRGEAAFGSWLYSIALNEIRGHFGKQKREDLKPVEEYLPAQGAHSEGGSNSAHVFDWGDPHRILESRELREVIDEAINELPIKYREAFVLRYFEELPVKEVAELIKESVAATKSRILRARLAVRDKLNSVFEDRYGRKMH
ncbi:MAG: sigma-70 family RNA polymerase sigma factor [candidate division Zixibacteria bacterium]|nr:sigma-70 family RNA polymerase sigma factor [candidate division Zixibacteria bacterium]